MKKVGQFVALSLLASSLCSGAAFAQDHDDHHDRDRDHHDSRDNHHYVRHNEWRKGYHMQHQDWDRGERVDYRTYHLHRPPNGYEWRQVDGNYVMAAVATGVIASIVVASTMH